MTTPLLPLPKAVAHILVGDDSEDVFTTEQVVTYARANLAASAPSAQTVGEDERTPADYAIEHAEYMAKDGERLIEAVHELATTQQRFDEDKASDSDVDQVKSDVDEALRSLRNSIYEFRKRAERAKAARASVPAAAVGERFFPFEFEVWQDGEMVASASGPRDMAMNEAMGYARQYSQDGRVHVFEVVRNLVHSTPNSASQAGGQEGGAV